MAAVLLIFAVCLLSLSSAYGGQDATQNGTGPDILVTDGTRNMTLTCHAGSFPVIRYVWLTHVPKTTRCETGPTDNVCTLTPRLKDDNQNVTCVMLDTQGASTRALYRVNLKYPPQSKPNITMEPSEKKPLKQGDVITCTVSGGKPSVASVTFYCQNPDHEDQDDVVSDDGRSVSSSIKVDTSKATEQDMECTCNANWGPEPGLYQDKTIMSFQLELSRPRVFGTSYNSSHPPILAATGRKFFLVAYPTPDTTKSYFIRPNKGKKRVPDNTFKTEFTENFTMEHLVNCRVTPQNVPEENLGLYELSISNRLGDVSVFVNVTSPVIQHSEKKAIDTGIIVGGVIGGIALLVGTIVIIVILVIRRKRRAGYKEHDDKTSKTPTMTPAATLHVVQPDPNNKINACPSSTFIDSNGGTNDNREQDDYNHLNENTAPPVDSSTYSRVGDDSRGAQQEGSADSATPNSITSRPDQPTDMVIGPKGDVYATVAPKSKGGNPSTTDEVHT